MVGIRKAILGVGEMLSATANRPGRRTPARKIRNGGPTVRVGDTVRLVTPDNPRLDSTLAVVVVLTTWGAHCTAPAAATLKYRALWSEMEMVRPQVEAEYTGDFCSACGSSRMRQSGTCKVCEDCGESDGCG